MTTEPGTGASGEARTRVVPIYHRDLFTSLWGVMHFPNDPGKARGFAAAYLTRVLGVAIDDGYVWDADQSREYLASMVLAPPPHEVRTQNESGIAVGEIVKVLWCLICEDRATASWERAILVAENAAVEHGLRGGRATFRKRLRQFSPVLHLWGAWALRGRRTHEDPDQGYTGVDDLNALILEAMNLHRLLIEWRDERNWPDQVLLSDDVFVPGEDWPPIDLKRWPGIGSIPIITLPAELVPGIGRPGARGKPRPT